MGQTRAQKIVKQLAGSVQKQTAIATDMFIPNHSGDNSAGNILKTPTKDTDIPNKVYVDDADALLVPYTGAIADVDLGVYDITTTGTGTFGSTNDQITLNDANSKFHIYGDSANDYGKVDTGIDFISVAKPDYITTLTNLGAGNVDIGEHHYHVEYYTAWGSTGIKVYYSAPSITLGSTSEVRVTIPVSSDYRVIGRRIYRTKADESSWVGYLLADIPNNTATTYDDNTADAGLPASLSYMYYYPNKAIPLIMIDEESALVIAEGATSLGYQTGVGGEGVSIGDYAGQDLSITAVQNTLIGSRAGRNLVTGISNTIIGSSAGSTLTAASNNIIIGRQALDSGTGGGHNMIIGNSAGRYVAGSYNVFIGSYAGGGSAIGNSARNIGIGYSALSSLDDTGNGYNIAMGWNIGSTITTGTYNILLGKDAEPSSPTASNEMVVTNINSADFGGADITTTGDVSGATLTAGNGFTGTGAYTNFTIVNGIITNAS